MAGTDMLKQVAMEDLSDSDLVHRLKTLGYNPPGPITHTTRGVYKKKLRRLSAGSVGEPSVPVKGPPGDCLSGEQELVPRPPAQCVSNGAAIDHRRKSTDAQQVSRALPSPKDIFISYGRGTVSDIEQLKETIERAGYTVWLDTNDILGGSDWHSAIGTALNECQALVALISSKYLSSQHCKNELYMANSRSKSILPVLLEEGLDDPGVMYAISSVNWIRAVDKFNAESVGVQLVQGLKELGIQPSLKSDDSYPGLSGKQLRDYTVDEVCALVGELEIDPTPFRANSVGGEDLLSLSEGDMERELHLRPLQIRKLKRKLKVLTGAE